MKPFSTPVLAKRTYRELKLLKHLRHENVISLSDIFISPLEDLYVTPCLTACPWCERHCGMLADTATGTSSRSCSALICIAS